MVDLLIDEVRGADLGAADHVAHRHAGTGSADHRVLLSEVADLSVFSNPQIRLSCRRTSVRDTVTNSKQPCRLHDGGVASDVSVLPRSRMSGSQLRSRADSQRMEIRLQGETSPRRPSVNTAVPQQNDPADRQPWRLRDSPQDAPRNSNTLDRSPADPLPRHGLRRLRTRILTPPLHSFFTHENLCGTMRA